MERWCYYRIFPIAFNFLGDNGMPLNEVKNIKRQNYYREEFGCCDDKDEAGLLLVFCSEVNIFQAGLLIAYCVIFY